MGVEKKVYSFRLEEEMVERLKGYAVKENRNLSNFVETILQEKLAQLEENVPGQSYAM